MPPPRLPDPRRTRRVNITGVREWPASLTWDNASLSAVFGILPRSACPMLSEPNIPVHKREKRPVSRFRSYPMDMRERINIFDIMVMQDTKHLENSMTVREGYAHRRSAPRPPLARAHQDGQHAAGSDRGRNGNGENGKKQASKISSVGAPPAGEHRKEYFF